MIREIQNENHSPVLTSDCWHVLRARWTGDSSAKPLYQRTIVSEHQDSLSAATAARAIVATFVDEMVGRKPETRDQVLVRRPGYKSLKIGKRTGSRSK